MKSGATDLAKTGVRRLLRRAGHALHCSEYLHKYCLGYHLAELFRGLNIQTVLDVGAHTGGYYRFLRNEVGFRGLVISFEPVRRHAEALRAHARSDLSWVIYDCALGAAAGQRSINVMCRSVFSSFLEPEHSVVSDFADLNQIEHRELVRVETLDGIMENLRAKHEIRETYLKMDTQGFDLQVLHGARRSLTRVAALQTEVSVRPIYKEMPDFSTVYSALVEMGFDLTGLYPVTRDSSLRLVEMDCVMINRQRISNPFVGANAEVNCGA